MKFVKALKLLSSRKHRSVRSTNLEKRGTISDNTDISTRSLSVKRPSSIGIDLSPMKATLMLEACHMRWVQQIEKNPNLQIAVIGGGIYGCHFANVFQKACEAVELSCQIKVNAKLTIFEKDAALFSQASGKNSFRIHKGFHYPRTGNTRRMCYDDHGRFCQHYSHFFQTTDHDEDTPAFAKVFAIAKDDRSKLDYEAMCNLLAGAKYRGRSSMWDEIDGELWSEEIRQSDDVVLKRNQMEELGFNVDMIDGAFLVQAEPILYADKPREWFTRKFTESPFVELVMGRRVDREDIREDDESGNFLIHEEAFDLALNCTYNQAIPMTPANHVVFYDLCISVIVAEKPNSLNQPALSFGIFDGPFPSLEPYDFSDRKNLPDELKQYSDLNLLQIFDVKLSSIGSCCDPEEAYKMMKNWETKKQEGSEDYQKIVQDIWDKCELFFPRLGVDFQLAGTWFALKTKVEDENASRPIIVVPDESVDNQGRFIQVFSSKLTSIFKAEEEVLDLIEDSEDCQEYKDTMEMCG